MILVEAGAITISYLHLPPSATFPLLTTLLLVSSLLTISTLYCLLSSSSSSFLFFCLAFASSMNIHVIEAPLKLIEASTLNIFYAETNFIGIRKISTRGMAGCREWF